uniref:PX domain/WD domain, G-beta repeat, putative n=1 Tax=Theileria annulata TaxID=5874 RepID=A0A3B0MM00_THEAN
MDLSKFSVSVKKGKSHRFQYEINIAYNCWNWSRYRTFAEFEELQRDLDKNFCDVPALPDIEFTAGLGALEHLHNAVDYLDNFLKELFARPDTRCSQHLLEFVDLIHYLDEVPTPPMIKLVSTTAGYNYAVSDCVVLENECSLIVAYEEKTFLSKLGKLWSFIELETLGAIKIFQYDEFEYKFVEKKCLTFTQKVRCICYDEDSKILVMGTDLGFIKRFRLLFKEDGFEFEEIDTLKLHENAILSIKIYDGHYYTSGYDGNIRKVNVKSNRVVAGGRLTKRLNGHKIMTATVEKDVMLVGSSDNDILSYYMEREIPVLVNTTKLLEPLDIRKILVCGKNVFISHGNTISCYSYNKTNVDLSGNNSKPKLHSNTIELCTLVGSRNSNSSANVEKTVNVSIPGANRTARFSPSSTSSILHTNKVYSIVVRSKNKQLIAGHDEVITMWCTSSGRMLFIWKAHRDEQVHFLHLMEKGDLLLSGGSDGRIRLWKLPEDEKLTLWTPS